MKHSAFQNQMNLRDAVKVQSSRRPPAKPVRAVQGWAKLTDAQIAWGLEKHPLWVLAMLQK